MAKIYDQSQLNSLQYNQSHLNSDIRIFGNQFSVDYIIDPQISMPKDFHNISQYKLTSYQQCCVSCGNACLCCFLFWNLITCNLCRKSCNFYYPLQTSKAGIVQQYGRYTRLLNPGFNYINFCSEQVIQIDMRMVNLSLPKQIVMTNDNIQLLVEANVFYRIINPLKVLYGLGKKNIQNTIREAAVSTIRNSVGQHTLDEILSTRSTYLQSSKKILQDQVNKMGLHIQHFFLTQILLPPQIQRNLTAVAKQKRISQASIIYSQSNVQAAKLMKQSADLISTKAAMQIRYLQMLTQLNNKNGNITVILPIGVNKIGKVKK